MPEAVKHNWLGGMNSQLDPSKRDFQQGYYLGINIRTRKGVPTSIKGPLNITGGLPTGQKKQGLYTFGESLLAFVGGAAYVQINGSGPWIQLSNFQMSTTADDIDTCLVPSSTVNFIRTATSTTTQADNAVVFGDPIAASPQCLVCMDGETQSRVIFEDGTSRVLQTYAQWTPTGAEYVPIARFPTYVDGILYCVGKDARGNYTQIYRSVTGRPLDFVILLNSSGNKISGLESEGGAPQLATRVSFASVTAMQVVSALPGGFVVSTKNGSWLVQPDYTFTIAAEPTFRNQFLFDVGAVGKNAIVDVLGDTTIVCRSGVRSFNGVQQFRWQGKNAPFSANVNNFISNQEQTVTAGISYDDYAFYALSTRYGPGILVYDFLQQAFVGIDLYKNVGLIKQFAKVQVGTTEKLYFYTVDGEVFQAFAGTTAKAQIFCNELVPESVKGSHRINDLDVVFSNIAESGYAETFIYSDNLYANVGAQRLVQSTSNDTTPTNLPYNTPIGGTQCQNASFNYMSQNARGWRAMIGVCWDADASILELGVKTTEDDSYTYPTPSVVTTQVENYVLAAIGNDGTATTGRVALNKTIQKLGPACVIGSGNHASYPGANANIGTHWAPYWSVYHTADRFHAATGVNELATTNGEPWYRTLRQGPHHYSYKDFDTTRVYFLTSGWARLNPYPDPFPGPPVQVEPSNLDGPTIELSTQMQWLKNTIAGSDKRFNIVCWFDAPYSSNPLVATQLSTIPLKSWGVDLLITGNGAMYERLTTPEGLTVINNGTGGGTLYTGALTLSPYSRYVKQGMFGFVKLVTNPLRLVATFQDANNTVYDTVTL